LAHQPCKSATDSHQLTLIHHATTLPVLSDAVGSRGQLERVETFGRVPPCNTFLLSQNL
jgi:hypothetical protein